MPEPNAYGSQFDRIFTPQRFFRHVCCACGAGGLVTALSHDLSVSTSALIALLAFTTGGFTVGLGRWLYYRGRDMLMLAPSWWSMLWLK